MLKCMSPALSKACNAAVCLQLPQGSWVYIPTRLLLPLFSQLWLLPLFAVAAAAIIVLGGCCCTCGGVHALQWGCPSYGQSVQ
jgi:hypothetical protein